MNGVQRADDRQMRIVYAGSTLPVGMKEMTMEPSRPWVKSAAPGRIALVGEYLDFLDGRAVTCAVHELRYELLVQVATENQDIPNTGIDNLSLVPAVSALLAAQSSSVPRVSVVIQERLPAGAGLGSSAAFAVALAAAIGTLSNLNLTAGELADIAVRAERRMGISGGWMDQYSAALGGVHGFQAHVDGTIGVTKLGLPSDIVIVVADSREYRRSGEVIDTVMDRYKLNDARVQNFIARGAKIADDLQVVLSDPGCDIAFVGELVNLAHADLRDLLDISTPTLERLIGSAIAAGAYGAKVIGAGKGGCIFALCHHTQAASICDALRAVGGDAYMCTPAQYGVMVRRDELA